MEGLILMKSFGRWLRSRIAIIGDKSALNADRCFALADVANIFLYLAWAALAFGILAGLLGYPAAMAVISDVGLSACILTVLLTFIALFWRLGYIALNRLW